VTQKRSAAAKILAETDTLGVTWPG